MVHQYKLGGYNIVLDIASGSVHAVDEVAYDIIKEYKEKSRPELLLSLAEKYTDRADITESDLSLC